MRIIITLLLLLLFFLSPSYAQQNKYYAYLVAKLESRTDWQNNRNYFFIKTDLQNVHALDVYKLKDYNPKATSNTQTASFYFDKTANRLHGMYNYFTSESDALLFLGEHGWELVSVYNNLQSEGNTLYDQVFTRINSEPVYYFRKQFEREGL